MESRRTERAFTRVTGTDVAPATRARRILVASQVVFFLALAWCILIEHGPEARSDGISYYGVNHRTVLIAIVGYAAAAVGLWRVSTIFRQAGLDPLVWLGLRLVAAMLVLLLLTPYNEGTFYNWAHMTTGVIGALIQIAIAIALMRQVGSAGAVAAFSVQLLGGILSAASLPDWRYQLLLYPEIVIQLGFSWCLLEWTRALPRGRHLQRAR